MLFTVRHRRWFVLGWIVLLLVAAPLARNITHNLTPSGFERPHSAAVWADQATAHLVPVKTVPPLLATGISRARMQAALAPIGGGRWLHPLGRHRAVLIAPASRSGMLAQAGHRLQAAGARIQPVTQAAVAARVIHDTKTTLGMSLPVALPFLLVLLLLVFGSLAAAALPLVVAAAGAVLALAGLDLIENVVSLSTYLTDIVSFLALGVGVDYALFISARFRQALDRGRDTSSAVAEAMRHAGRSVLFSGVAVALAVATLLLGGNAYWRGIAIGGAVAVLAVLVVTHTLLPSILSYLGPGIRWGRIPGMIAFRRFWPAVAARLRRRPALGVAIAVVVLGIPATFGLGLRMQTPANLAVMLPRNDALRQAVTEQQHVQGAGSIAPITVVLRLKPPVTSVGAWRQVERVSLRLRRLPDVARVTSPLSGGVPPALVARAVRGGSAPAALKTVLPGFVNPAYDPHLVLIAVTARTGPNAARTVALTQRISRELPRWVDASRTGVGGITALLNGFNHLTAERLPWILAAVACIAGVILYLATGALWQAVLGILFDGLVALATAGLLVLLVQRGSLGLEAEPLNSSITPLVFVLLFGLSMDYEVILLHRIQEVWKRGRSPADAAAEGLTVTGGMITGAGMIMVIVFFALLLSPLEIMQTLGIGLTAAILLDTWIVRSLLVPGSITLLGRHAFWPARPSAPPAGDYDTAVTEERPGVRDPS